MTLRLEEDDFLTIQLLRFDRPDALTERFYFMEMSTLQATTLILADRIIVRAKIVAYTDDGVLLTDDQIRAFKTIGGLNEFFLEHPDYYIHDCELQLDENLVISSHDDGEVSISFPQDTADHDLISVIFKKFNLREELRSTLSSHPGHYIAIDKDSRVIGNYATFDDYLKVS